MGNDYFEEVFGKIKKRKIFLEGLQLMENKDGIEIDLAVGIRLDEINEILKLFENSKVALRKLVYATNASTLFFTGNAKGILAAYQKISQVVVPQVGVKTTNSRNVKELMDLLINAGDELFLLVIASVKFFANVRQREQ